MAARGGLGGLVIIVAVLYFTGAGTWLWQQTNKLDQNCYNTLDELGASVANPLCDGLSVGVAALKNVPEQVGSFLSEWQHKLANTGEFNELDSYTRAIEQKVAALASTKEQLGQMIQFGPQTMNGSSVAQQFQQAVDSFSIGQLYLKDGNNSEAITWLQSGAAQPDGFGVLSQMTLGNMYAQGRNGVKQNPQLAQQYLEQARVSINVLSKTNSPQAQSMLQNLPASPQTVKLQLEKAIQQLRVGR